MHERSDRFRVKIGSPKDPRTIRERVIRVDFSSIDGEAESSRTDAQERSRLCQVHPCVSGGIIFAKTWNPIVASERCDAFFRPAITTSSPQAVAVKYSCDKLIRADARQ